MSDNDDLLGDDHDDLGDQSLADYNLGNEEEEQLLADDYDTGASQNVPPSVGYGNQSGIATSDYTVHGMDYGQSELYVASDTESVVPNITVEVPNVPSIPNIPSMPSVQAMRELPTYAPYEPPPYEVESAVVPPAIPASPIESPQIVPSEVLLGSPNDSLDGGGPRERFTSERPAGSQRTPQIRDIPDSLDKVFVPRGGFAPRNRTTWRNPQLQARFNHPYRRNNMQRGNFQSRPSFPPPQQQPRPSPPNMEQNRPRLEPPQIAPDLPMPPRPPFRPEEGPNRGPGPFGPDDRPIRGPFGPDDGPNMRPFRPNDGPNMRGPFEGSRPFGPDDGPMMGQRQFRPDDGPFRPDDRPNMPFRPDDRPNMPFRPDDRPNMPFDGPNRPFIPGDGPPRHFRPDDGPNMPFRQERPMFGPMQRFGPNQNFGPNMGPMQRFPFRPQFNRFGPPREVAPNNHHMPQVTIRQPLPGQPLDKMAGREPEVRMLPVQLPGHLPPAGLAGKKVLINPHFKGNFQPPPVEGLAYIPTRINKSPPLSPTLESKFGPTNIDDAAERFIAEQRSALARAANRKPRSPQRFIENTTIEIENDLASGPPRGSPPGPRGQDLDLLRRQEEFINANRAGLRRRMRSPSPPRRSVSPRRSLSPRRERRAEPPPRYGPLDEESEYRRRVREQESMRERVLRAKEVRRRKNAVALHKQIQERQREQREKETPKPADPSPQPSPPSQDDRKPDSTTKVERERSPQRDNNTPPREPMDKPVEKLEQPKPAASPERALTPPLPPLAPAAAPATAPAAPAAAPMDSDDELDLILDDIDGILSDDDDETGRFKDKPKKPEPPKPRPAVDLRSKLPPKSATEAKRPPKQRIIFSDEREEKKKRVDKTPPTKKSLVTSSTNTENNENLDKADKRHDKTKQEAESVSLKSRPRITFDAKEQEPEKEPAQSKPDELKRAQPFASRRVVLQRKISTKKSPDKPEKSVFHRIEIKNDPTKPNPGIFSRAVRTAIGADQNRIVIKKHEEPQVEYESDGSEEDRLLSEESGSVAMVTNLPHGMTDTRLKTLAGNDVQSVSLDKEERSARVAFKTSTAADTFRRKFNNKMVAASRLTVTLR